MRTRVLLVAAVLTATTVSGCGGEDSKDAEPAPSAAQESPEPELLASGKSLLELEDGKEYVSPSGFAPQLRLKIPGDGWVSTHRGADGFDVGQPVPDVDAALLVVAFLTAPEPTADQALQTISQRAEAAGATVDGAGGPTLHVTGGDGPLVTSRDGGIALDAVPDGYSTIEVTDTGGGTLLTVTWVPDAANQAQADQQAAALLGLVTQS
jgi:hypothetical protein